MASSRPASRILILDDDLGFAMWLGRILNEAGFAALPASTAQEADAILDEEFRRKINLLIANLEVEGSRELIARLSGRGGRFRLIAIGDTVEDIGRRRIRARLHRPPGRSAPSPDGYVETVRSVLA